MTRIALGFALGASTILLVAAVRPQQPGLTPAQRAVLDTLSVVRVPDGHGGTIKTLRASGVNMQIVNGLGATGTVNGVGNLIVGYNEVRGDGGDAQTGSHNLVVGARNNYTSYGAGIVGYENDVEGAYATALSTENSIVSAWCGSAIGGFYNTIFPGATHATIGGGFYNAIWAASGHVCGGSQNQVFSGGQAGVVGGGRLRVAGGAYDWVAGALTEDQ